MSSICVISTAPPFHGIKAREALDIVFVSASFDLKTALVVMGDGVYQLLNKQKETKHTCHSLIARLRSLPLYGIEKIYVDQKSLEDRYLKYTDIISMSSLIDSNQLKLLLIEYSKVMTF